MNKFKEKIKKSRLYNIIVLERIIRKKIHMFFYPIILYRARIIRKCPSNNGITIKKYNNEIIISLTSFPERINCVHKTIYTLMNQDFKPNRIILWLSSNQFVHKEKDLPLELLQLKNKGLTIKWTDNDIKSFKKLVPALKEFPNSIIVTADDDLYYPRYWLKNLMESYYKYPNDIHCHLVTVTKWNGNEFVFKDQYGNKSSNKESYSYKILGGSGTLYPPKSLFKDVINEEKFMALAPTNDDIWFWAMALLNNIKIRWIKNNMKRLYYIENSQEKTPCLVNENNHGKNLRQEQTKNVFYEYNLFEKLEEINE